MLPIEGYKKERNSSATAENGGACEDAGEDAGAALFLLYFPESLSGEEDILMTFMACSF